LEFYQFYKYHGINNCRKLLKLKVDFPLQKNALTYWEKIEKVMLKLGGYLNILTPNFLVKCYFRFHP